MDLSETIVAAIIGALATMATAIFQLVRNRAPSESRPKKNRMRSLVATIALMIGCIVGGYAWSALRAVSANDEMKSAMEAEFTKQFSALAARQAEALKAAQTPRDPVTGEAITASNAQGGSAESLVHLPPCRTGMHPDEVGPVTCNDRSAQPVALCATIPSNGNVTNLRVQARVPKSESPWLERDAGAPTLGSLHIAEAHAEYPVSADRRSVCLDVANWSVVDTLAVRVIVDYDFSPAQGAELTAAAPTGTTL